MKSHRSSHSIRARKLQSDPATSAILQELKSLNQKQENQEVKRLPRTPDIPVMKLKQQRIYNFRETYSAATITASTSLPVFGALNFQINSLGDLSSYQGLFDAYRIIQAEVQFIPKYVVGSNTGVPLLFTVIDYDDSSTPTQISQLLDYDTVQISPGDVLQSRVLTPRAALGVYGSTLTSYGQTANSQWMDLASPQVQYYGVKYGLEAAAYSAGFYEVIVTLTIQTKSQK